MPRSPLVYLTDIVAACDAIERYVAGADVASYCADDLVRSAVERQLILIGEAVGSLLRARPDVSVRISHARRIVDFRNQLTHNYAAIDDAVVWSIATSEVPVLREECRVLLAEFEAERETAD